MSRQFSSAFLCLGCRAILISSALEQSTLAQSARQRLFFGTYPGGHMFYLRSRSRAEFTADVKGFFAGTP
jgi:hypothetical protein